MYVKGGRARCYLACSPDEISASSFRPSFPLLPRSSPPSLPSSYAFFLFCFYLSALFPVYRISSRRSCKAKTFSARAIVRLLIALGFPLFPPSPRFLFFLFKFVFFSWFFFFHTSRIFHISLLNADSRSLSLLLCNFYLTDNHFFSRVFFRLFYFEAFEPNLNSFMFLS